LDENINISPSGLLFSTNETNDLN